MANKSISGLTASASNLASADLAPVVQTVGVGPVKMTGLQIAGGLLGSTTFNGATVTTSSPVLNLSQTWNAGAVTFTGLVFNATSTASASGSLLLDLQVGGVSKLSVRKDGFIFGNGLSGNQVGVAYLSPATFSLGSSHDVIISRAAAASLQLGASDAAAPVAQTLQVQSVVAGTTNTAGANFTIKGSAGTGTGAGGSIILQVAPAGSTGTAQNAYATALTLGSDSNKTATFAGAMNVTAFSYWGGGTKAAINQNGTGDITTAAGGEFSFGSFGVSSPDVKLFRDAANTLALRNGTNAQTFNIYNSYTDAANYSAMSLYWSSTVFVIAPTRNGTGSFITDLRINTGSSSPLSLQTANITRLQIDANGNWLAGADNTYDIGASGANRPRNVFVASNLCSNEYRGATNTRNTSVSIGANWVDFINASGQFNFRITPSGTTAGVVVFSDNSGSFDRLQFGGTTSSFPALKRSSASLICRLADDSANAAFEALSLKTAAPAGGTSGTWKVGVYNATAPAATGYVEVDIGGTLYKLLAAT